VPVRTIGAVGKASRSSTVTLTKYEDRAFRETANTGSDHYRVAPEQICHRNSSTAVITDDERFLGRLLGARCEWLCVAA
jgi:hypothetical protein